jgi:phage terminase large subunit-like protein
MGDGFNMILFGQGFHDMNPPTKELLRLIADKALLHGGNPVLRWMASNTATETDAAGNLKPSKKKSTERIDGIVAAVMALGRAMLRDGDGSVYEGRGVLILGAPEPAPLAASAELSAPNPWVDFGDDDED